MQRPRKIYKISYLPQHKKNVAGGFRLWRTVAFRTFLSFSVATRSRLKECDRGETVCKTYKQFIECNFFQFFYFQSFLSSNRILTLQVSFKTSRSEGHRAFYTWKNISVFTLQPPPGLNVCFSQSSPVKFRLAAEFQRKNFMNKNPSKKLSMWFYDLYLK